MHIHKHNIGRRSRRRRRRSCGNSYKVHHSWPGNGFIFPHSVPFPPLPAFFWIDSITMILYSAESPHVYSISRKIGSTYLPSSIRFIKFLKYSTVQEMQVNPPLKLTLHTSWQITILPHCQTLAIRFIYFTCCWLIGSHEATMGKELVQFCLQRSN